MAKLSLSMHFVWLDTFYARVTSLRDQGADAGRLDAAYRTARRAPTNADRVAADQLLDDVAAETPPARLSTIPPHRRRLTGLAALEVLLQRQAQER